MLVILYKRGDIDETQGTSPVSSYYYSLDDRQQNLFNPFTLTVSWGKNPEGGCRKQYTFKTLAEKNIFIRKLLGNKLRSYKVLYSYFKDRQERTGLALTETDGSGIEHGLADNA